MTLEPEARNRYSLLAPLPVTSTESVSKTADFHLRSNEALPDQLVEAELIAVEEFLDQVGLAQHGGGADSLVRFLSAFGLGRYLGGSAGKNFCP